MSNDLLFFTEITLAGLGSGALLALTALAFVLIYKATRVINLAVSEILMLGGYLFLAFAAGMGLPVWAALPMAVLGGGLVGAVVERGLIRPMLGESPISVFMVTVGLGSVIIGLVELFWGTDPRTLPGFIANTPVFLGEAYVSRKIVVAFIAAGVVIGVFLLLFRFWRGGWRCGPPHPTRRRPIRAASTCRGCFRWPGSSAARRRRGPGCCWGQSAASRHPWGSSACRRWWW